ncbi:chemosensory receptor a [Plakobranchus ocellatus]|uniref:Chemosensory receptor a n=1 Tax=Plakobranchus ocellatus TaxID=259542 RepID=A0AAV4CVT3_9GAST|nr:chemosensory receptor a [Plakobranchus ocellatus]
MGLNQLTINVGFCALSVADLVTLITLFLMGLVNSPLYPYLGIPMYQYDATLFLTGPFMSASTTSHCITALISLERCVCVVMPLKVRSIFTMTRVRAAVVTIWAVITLGAVPKYATTNIRWREQPDTNTTILVFEYTPLMREVETVTIQIMNVIIPFLIYLFVVFCTAFLVVKLKQASKWRRNIKSMAMSPQTDEYCTASTNVDSGSTSSSGKPTSRSVNKTKSKNPVVEGSRVEISKADSISIDKNLRKVRDDIIDEEKETVDYSAAELGQSKNEKDLRLSISDRDDGKSAFTRMSLQEEQEFSQNEKKSGHTIDSTKTTKFMSSMREAKNTNKKHPTMVTVTKVPDSNINQGKEVQVQSSIRELKVLKFVIVICVIFLTCTSPTVVLISISMIWPKFHVNTPEFKNLLHLLISFPFLTQCISSSINIVFYMRMSSRYRPTCIELFRLCRYRRKSACPTKQF